MQDRQRPTLRKRQQLRQRPLLRPLRAAMSQRRARVAARARRTRGDRGSLESSRRNSGDEHSPLQSFEIQDEFIVRCYRRWVWSLMVSRRDDRLTGMPGYKVRQVVILFFIYPHEENPHLPAGWWRHGKPVNSVTRN